MSGLDIETRLKEIIESALSIDKNQITAETQFEDFDIDSLDIIELVLALEVEFHCEIPDEAAEKMVTFGYVLNYLQQL